MMGAFRCRCGMHGAGRVCMHCDRPCGTKDCARCEKLAESLRDA